ncbi:hypothetical protein KSF78_0009004 [Schistosoma japonicum]|nr:hypothetical protein KSF78_0009004 [Schistosoma japonicum]
MTDSGDSEKMLLSFLLFFNVFILLVYSSPQDRKINEKLERQNGTINEYVDCKINNLNANHGLTIRFCLISKMRSIYGEYVTDEDEENWTICIMYHEEKSKKSDNFVQANRVSKNAKKAAEYNIEKCKKLASPYPYDLNELDSLLLERQAVVLLSTNCLYERHKQ